eukprot:CAMPEP_0205823888 /NCGR_PEP_ID=MMETSP0206-20130828/18344_1 /ASSEMBLY_ACC=CAM_ASM_000279 /TAXON_ID=36767 /ORGANISM="Euplotes focardii, Strain TN1" /LENGTH=96 /DNA_ID=CAMNT_0053121443 /DNA_START=235 /DNA_END=525 /DNA_ORIENTATION=-
MIDKESKQIDKMLIKNNKWDELRQKIDQVKAQLFEANEENKDIRKELKTCKKMLPNLKSQGPRRSPEKPLYPKEAKDAFFNNSDVNYQYSLGAQEY